ncbi:MAG: protein phosphatase 2C domain-containing protein [Polyangiaceae bacterium]
MPNAPAADASGASSLLEYAAGTTLGSCREVNEDAFGVFADLDAFVVVDGCGGVSSGESAARLTVECFRRVLREQVTRTGALLVADPLAVATFRANTEVFREASTHPARRGQGAALCAVRAFEGWITIAHVGDCRVGRQRDGTLVWLTEDHDLASELRRAGASRRQQEEVGELHSTVITRAVGIGEHLPAEVGYHPTLPGDVYLLCSDGLSRQVEQSRIAAIVSRHSQDLSRCCSALLQASEDAGGQDSATVILLRLRA